jgi:DNA-binding response OmpR family regulator
LLAADRFLKGRMRQNGVHSCQLWGRVVEPRTASVPIRFGSFEVLPASGELRKNGTRLKLTGQAIQVLLTLLEKPGQLVTREELQQKL